MVVLQNCIDLQKVVPGSHNETSLAFSYDGNQVIDIKVEGVTGIQEEEDPLRITSPVIKAEHEVSYMAVCQEDCICCSLFLEYHFHFMLNLFEEIRN
jgi:hypothetical protein